MTNAGGRSAVSDGQMFPAWQPICLSQGQADLLVTHLCSAKAQHLDLQAV